MVDGVVWCVDVQGPSVVRSEFVDAVTDVGDEAAGDCRRPHGVAGHDSRRSFILSRVLDIVAKGHGEAKARRQQA